MDVSGAPRQRRGTHLAVALALATSMAGCALPVTATPEERPAAHEPPARFTIVPDNYHVPYAGTAADGRKFFLSDELFDPAGSSYVGLFLWNADGTFDEVRVDEVDRPDGQVTSADADHIVRARLAELGTYVLEPIQVEPFTEDVDGVTFGWNVGRYDDGTYYISIEPGDFIAYHEPWDGLGYDT